MRLDLLPTRGKGQSEAAAGTSRRVQEEEEDAGLDRSGPRWHGMRARARECERVCVCGRGAEGRGEE
jgi:hypothetical protein